MCVCARVHMCVYTMLVYRHDQECGNRVDLNSDVGKKHFWGTKCTIACKNLFTNILCVIIRKLPVQELILHK